MSVDIFLQQHPSFAHFDVLNAVCKPLAQWQISYFSHVRMNSKKQMYCLAQAPDFLQHYILQGYYNFDVHHLPTNTKEQFLLWDLIDRTGQSEQMHNDFSEYGFGHTFTIIRQGEHHIDYYNFAMPIGSDNLNHNYFQQLHHLKTFTTYFHDQISKCGELKKAYDLPLQCTNGNYLLSSAPEPQHTVLSVDKIFVPSADCYLSKREYECLRWAALGKSQEQIAQILGITHRTVKAHFTNLRIKLNCLNQFQLGVVFAELQRYWGLDSA